MISLPSVRMVHIDIRNAPGCIEVSSRAFPIDFLLVLVRQRADIECIPVAGQAMAGGHIILHCVKHPDLPLLIARYVSTRLNLLTPTLGPAP